MLINKLIGQYTDMPGYETARSSSSSQRRRLAITDGKAQHVRHTEAFKEMRVHEDHKSRVGIKANKLQKYFRVQIL